MKRAKKQENRETKNRERERDIEKWRALIDKLTD